MLKGYIWNEKIGSKETLWKNFWSYRDWSLQLSRISFQSRDIWIGLICKLLHRIYITLDNDFFWNQKYHWGCRTKSLKTVHVCVYPLALNQQTFERFNGIISIRYTSFPNKRYAVRRMRWSYLHIKQIQISQDWSEIRENCKDQSL